MHTRTELARVWPPTAEASREAGHTDDYPLEAIRRKCVDCCCGNAAEVRRCEAVTCALWPFRAGRYPAGRRELKIPEPFRQPANRQRFCMRAPRRILSAHLKESNKP